MSYLATSDAAGIDDLERFFSNILCKNGVDIEKSIVIYEHKLNEGLGQSSRGLFLLKYLGCEDVSVLDGGYLAWLKANFNATLRQDADTLSDERRHMTTKPVSIKRNLMITKDEMLEALSNPSIVKLDVRDEDEWLGISSSPRGVNPCPRSGRMPSALWMEWYRTLDDNSGVPIFKPKEEMLRECKQVGITPDTPVYVYCFKGARASHVFVALKESGIKDVRVYFGSWNEWSRDFDLPVDEVDQF